SLSRDEPAQRAISAVLSENERLAGGTFSWSPVTRFVCGSLRRSVLTAPDLDSDRLLDVAHEAGEILGLTAASVCVAPPLFHAIRHPHRNAQRFRLFEAKANILVHELGPEAEIERPRQHGLRELVADRSSGAAARVDDVDHLVGIQPRLGAEDERL